MKRNYIYVLLSFKFLPNGNSEDGRWDHVVIEKVYEGPISMSEVVGWWKATFFSGVDKERVVSYEKIERPECYEGTFNFTGVG